VVTATRFCLPLYARTAPRASARAPNPTHSPTIRPVESLPAALLFITSGAGVGVGPGVTTDVPELTRLTAADESATPLAVWKEAAKPAVELLVKKADTVVTRLLAAIAVSRLMMATVRDAVSERRGRDTDSPRWRWRRESATDPMITCHVTVMMVIIIVMMMMMMMIVGDREGGRAWLWGQWRVPGRRTREEGSPAPLDGRSDMGLESHLAFPE
jgi:hypothetical protein